MLNKKINNLYTLQDAFEKHNDAVSSFMNRIANVVENSNCEIKKIIRHLKVDGDPEDDFDIDERSLQKICKQAEADCLKQMNDHCISYFFGTCPKTLSYENWIQHFHPENVKMGFVDDRFYLRGSTHRIVWNRHCEMLYHEDLKICHV